MKLFHKREKYILIATGVIGINYFLDRITKYIAIAYLKGNEPFALLNNLILLVYAENPGAFLGLGTDWNRYLKYALLLITPIIAGIIGMSYIMFKEANLYRIIIGSCIIGGGIGNLRDRLFNQFNTIDFMNFGIGNLRTGILNVADLSVTFGVILLLMYEIYETSIKNRKKSIKQEY
jgi:signal peptidase II